MFSNVRLKLASILDNSGYSVKVYALKTSIYLFYQIGDGLRAKMEAWGLDSLETFPKQTFRK